jgi:hypothetical protein
MSGPLQAMSGRFSDTSGTTSTLSTMSGSLDRSFSSSSSLARPQASVSHLIAKRHMAGSQRHNERSLVQFLARAASKLRFGSSRLGLLSEGSAELARAESLSDGDYRSPPKNNVQWAQGMAGEDRFHVAVSEEHGWVFVGIYDGFNGPDATDYLFANLYVAVHRELKGVLWDDIQGGEPVANADHLRFLDGGNDSPEFHRKPMKRGRTGRPEVDDAATSTGGATTTMQRNVLMALARALRKTEDAFFEAAEQRAEESPELGLVGSCVLVMLMKGTDVYVMNVGDSRVVLARRREDDFKNIIGKAAQGGQPVKAEIMRELKAHGVDVLQTVQLTAEHSTAVEEVFHAMSDHSSLSCDAFMYCSIELWLICVVMQEVMRIRRQHLNDRSAIVYGRVKGNLNVTRAFGAGYLKQVHTNKTVFASSLWHACSGTLVLS